MGGIKIKCLIICIKFVRAKPFAFPIGFVCIQFNGDSHDGKRLYYVGSGCHALAKIIERVLENSVIFITALHSVFIVMYLF